MKISIVTPVYNDPRVGNALNSIMGQSRQADECILVDAMSDEPTVAAIQPYAERIQWIREPDNGIYDAMNKGIGQATGEIVGILNADDSYYNSSVLEVVEDAFESTNADLVYGNLNYVNTAGDTVRTWRAGEMKRLSFQAGWMPPHPTCFVRRSLYDQVGLFDVSLSIAADYEFLLRALVKNKCRANYIDQTMVAMGIGGASNASIASIVRANLEVRQAWKKNGLPGGTLAPILKPMRKPVQFVLRRRRT